MLSLLTLSHPVSIITIHFPTQNINKLSWYLLDNKLEKKIIVVIIIKWIHLLKAALG